MMRLYRVLSSKLSLHVISTEWFSSSSPPLLVERYISINKMMHKSPTANMMAFVKDKLFIQYNSRQQKPDNDRREACMTSLDKCR
jgi:hypothetical protein